MIPTASSVKETLINTPSELEWELEIRRILNGDREKHLFRLGSISAFIDDILDSSKIVETETYFLRALKNIVQTWVVSKLKEKEYFVCMLELIGAHTPDGGTMKVIEFLQTWNISINELNEGYGYNSKVDLIMTSLVALESYFTSPPEFQSTELIDSYYKYIELLEFYLKEPAYCGYCAVRLIDLKRYDINDLYIKEAIKDNPIGLYEILSYIFSPQPLLKNYFVENIKKIAETVFFAGISAVNLFENILAKRKISISYNHSKLFIKLPIPKSTVTKSKYSFTIISNERTISIIFSSKDAQKTLEQINLLKITGLESLNNLLENFDNTAQSKREFGNKIEDIFLQCLRQGREAVQLFFIQLADNNIGVSVIEEENKLSIAVNEIHISDIYFDSDWLDSIPYFVYQSNATQNMIIGFAKEYREKAKNVSA